MSNSSASDLSPLYLLLNHELRFRTSILAKELFNLSCIVNFFSFKQSGCKNRKSRSRKRENIFPLKEIISIANRELKEIFNLLDSDIKSEDVHNKIFQIYERIVLVNNKLENTLKLLSFLQKKIKYTLEAMPPYSPAPTIFRDRQESKFYEALERIVGYTFSVLNEKNTKVSIYWETNTENCFLDLDDFSSIQQDNKIHFLFEGSFFIVNQPSMWPLVIHESVHFYLNKFCFKKEVRSYLREIREVIDKTCHKIYNLINKYGYSSTFVRSIIIDSFVDSILAVLLGPLYIVLLWRILFAYDETFYHLCIPLKRAWYIRLLIPIQIYENLRQRNMVPLLKIKKSFFDFKGKPLFNIPEFDQKIGSFRGILEGLQEIYIKNCYRPDQADMRRHIEEYIVFKVKENFLKLFKKQKKNLQKICQNIERDFSSLNKAFFLKTDQYDKNNDNLNKFALLNLTLSQYINNQLLEIEKNPEPLCEGRINTLFYKMIRDISDCQEEQYEEILKLINLVNEDSPDNKDQKSDESDISPKFFLNLCKKLKKQPVVLLSFIKLRFDSLNFDSLKEESTFNSLKEKELRLIRTIKDFKNKGYENNFWFYDLGSFNLVAADINFRDKYAGESTVTDYIEAIINENEDKNFYASQGTFNLWYPFIKEKAPFYKYDIALTPVKKISIIDKEGGKKEKKVDINILKSFFQRCYNSANLLAQISNDCFSIDEFIKEITKVLKKIEFKNSNSSGNDKALIEILVCVAFNWANYILIINIPEEIAKDNFGYYFVEFKRNLVNQYKKIGRSKTDILLGLNLPRKTIIPSPEILLRLSSDENDIESKINILYQNIDKEWSIYLRPGNFDLLLSNNKKKFIEFGEFLAILPNLQLLNPTDVQLRFSLPLELREGKNAKIKKS